MQLLHYLLSFAKRYGQRRREQEIQITEVSINIVTMTIVIPTRHYKITNVQYLCHSVGFSAVERTMPHVETVLMSLNNPAVKFKLLGKLALL